MSLLADTANQGATNPFPSPPLPPVQPVATPAPTPAPVSAPTAAPPQAPLPGVTVPTVNYDTTDPMGQYFANNPTAGDTWAQLQATLDQYGLQDLYDFVKNGIVLGWDTAQTYQHLRETPTYKTRFAGNEQRVANGLQPLSESEYLANEKQYAQALKSVGIPQSLYDSPADFASYIANDISPSELQDRAVKGYQTAVMSDHPTKVALQQMYGVSDGELAAYFLDPNRTEEYLMRQFTSAQIGGAATRTGWGDLSRDQAESLATMGVDAGQAATGFNKLASQAELMQGLPGTSEGAINADTQLAAVFGQDAAAQQEIQRRAGQRVATFAGQSTFASNKEGAAGIGAAQ